MNLTLIGHALRQLGRCKRRLTARYSLSGEITLRTLRRIEFHLEQPFMRDLPPHKAVLSEAEIRFIFPEEALNQNGRSNLNDMIFMQAIKCPWERIDDFRSLSEFKQFEKWMKEQIAANEAIEVPVINSYLGQYGGFDEKQYRHVASGKLWRLVWPDSPFTGIFEPVE